LRSYNLAAPLLLDSLSTFTSYELCSYSSLVVYSVLAGSVSLKRVDFKAKVVDTPEVKAILGDGEEKLAALTGAVSAGPGAGDEEMKDVSSATPGVAATAVNLTTLGTTTDAQAEAETPVDFTPLAGLVRSLYIGNYQAFFLALAAVEENFLSQDRYLYEHRVWFVREMRLRGYQQLLQSYRIVSLKSMANDFGVSVDFLDRHVAIVLNRRLVISNIFTGTWHASLPQTAFRAPSTVSTASSRPIDPTTRTNSTPTW
jgi:26S proteasome regulatory subunit N7